MAAGRPDPALADTSGLADREKAARAIFQDVAGACVQWAAHNAAPRRLHAWPHGGGEA